MSTPLDENGLPVDPNLYPIDLSNPFAADDSVDTGSGAEDALPAPPLPPITPDMSTMSGASSFPPVPASLDTFGLDNPMWHTDDYSSAQNRPAPPIASGDSGYPGNPGGVFNSRADQAAAQQQPEQHGWFWDLTGPSSPFHSVGDVFTQGGDVGGVQVPGLDQLHQSFDDAVFGANKQGPDGQLQHQNGLVDNVASWFRSTADNVLHQSDLVAGADRFIDQNVKDPHLNWLGKELAAFALPLSQQGAKQQQDFDQYWNGLTNAIVDDPLWRKDAQGLMHSVLGNNGVADAAAEILTQSAEIVPHLALGLPQFIMDARHDPVRAVAGLGQMVDRLGYNVTRMMGGDPTYGTQDFGQTMADAVNLLVLKKAFTETGGGLRGAANVTGIGPAYAPEAALFGRARGLVGHSAVDQGENAAHPNQQQQAPAEQAADISRLRDIHAQLTDLSNKGINPDTAPEAADLRTEAAQIIQRLQPQQGELPLATEEGATNAVQPELPTETGAAGEGSAASEGTAPAEGTPAGEASDATAAVAPVDANAAPADAGATPAAAPADVTAAGDRAAANAEAGVPAGTAQADAAGVPAAEARVATDAAAHAGPGNGPASVPAEAHAAQPAAADALGFPRSREANGTAPGTNGIPAAEAHGAEAAPGASGNTPTTGTGNSPTAERGAAAARPATPAGPPRGAPANDHPNGVLASGHPADFSQFTPQARPASAEGLAEAQKYEQRFQQVNGGQRAKAAIEVNPDKVSLPETASFPAPPKVTAGDRWWGNEVQDLSAQARTRGIDVPELPSGKLTDAQLVDIVREGWTGGDFYERLNQMVQQLPFDNALDRQRFGLLSGVFGMKQSTVDNGRTALQTYLLNRAGAFARAGEEFDPKLRDQLIERGLIKNTVKPISSDTVAAAFRNDIGGLSVKLNGYAGALLQLPEKFPIDMWMARIFFGTKDIPVAKRNNLYYSYAAGRTRHIAEVLGLPERQVQAALWYGYQTRALRALQALRGAADQMGDPKFKAQVDAIRGVDKVAPPLDDVYRDLGVREGQPMQEPSASMNLLGREDFRDRILKILDGSKGMAPVSRRFVKALGDKEYTRVEYDRVRAALRAPGNAELTSALADAYKQDYVDGGNQVAQTFGPQLEKVAREAFLMRGGKQAAEQLFQKAVTALHDHLAGVTSEQLAKFNTDSFIHAGLDGETTDHMVSAAIDSLEALGLDPRTVSLVEPSADALLDGRVAQFNLRTGQVQLSLDNAKWAGAITDVIRDVARSVRKAGYGDRVKPFEEASPADWLQNVIGHEFGHDDVHDGLGLYDAAGNRTLDPHIVVPRLLDFLYDNRDVAKAFTELGLGDEIETMIAHAVAYERTDLRHLDEMLGATSPTGEVTGKMAGHIVPDNVRQASINLLEFMADMRAIAKNVPLAIISRATDETLGRTLDKPRETKEAAALFSRLIDERLARGEAADRRAADRAATGDERIRRIGAPEAGPVGAAADGRHPTGVSPGDNLERVAAFGGDTAAPDQNGLAFGRTGSVLQEATRRYGDEAAKLGIVDRIRHLSAGGASAEGIARILPELRRFAPEDAVNIVRAAKSDLRIAEPRDEEAFQKWAAGQDSLGFPKSRAPKTEEERTVAQQRWVGNALGIIDRADKSVLSEDVHQNITEQYGREPDQVKEPEQWLRWQKAFIEQWAGLANEHLQGSDPYYKDRITLSPADAKAVQWNAKELGEPVGQDLEAAHAQQMLDDAKQYASQKPELAPNEAAPGSESMLGKLRENGGFTFQSISGDFVGKGEKVYGVSPYPEREMVLNADEVTPEHIQDFLVKNADLLAKEGHYVGGWRDGDKIYLDVSVVHSDRETAMELGRQYGQKAIWDFENGKEERLDTTAGPDGVATTTEPEPGADAGVPAGATGAAAADAGAAGAAAADSVGEPRQFVYAGEKIANVTRSTAPDRATFDRTVSAVNKVNATGKLVGEAKANAVVEAAGYTWARVHELTRTASDSLDQASRDEVRSWSAAFKSALEGHMGEVVAEEKAKEPQILQTGVPFEDVRDAPTEGLAGPHPDTPALSDTAVPQEVEAMRQAARDTAPEGSMPNELGQGELFPLEEILKKVDESNQKARAAAEADEQFSKVGNDLLGADDEVKAGSKPSGDILSELDRMINGAGGGIGGGKPPVAFSHTNPFDDDYKAIMQAVLSHQDGELGNAMKRVDASIRTLADGVNFSRGMHPIRAFKVIVHSVMAHRYLVNKAEDELRAGLQRLAKKMGIEYDDLNQRIAYTLERDDAVGRQRLAELRQLSPEAADFAHYMGKYWDANGKVLGDQGAIGSMIENFLPRIIRETPEGITNKQDGGRGNRISQASQHFLQRRKDATGEQVWKYIEDLEKAGFKVEKDIPTLFGAHARSTGRAARVKALVRFYMTNRVSDGGFVGHPIVTDEDYRSLPRDMQDQMRRIQYGPAKASLRYRIEQPGTLPRQGEYWVWKPLAEHMERLARIDEGIHGIEHLPIWANQANAFFKRVKFLLNPIHAYNMLSNLFTMAPVETATGGLWKLGQNALKDPEGLDVSNAIARGFTSPEARLRDADFGHESWMETAPVLKQWHNVMWNEIAYKMGLGLYLKLRDQYVRDAERKGIVTADVRQELEERAAQHAKTAVGFMDNLDMSRDWRLWGNFFTFALKWSTGQARTIGHATGLGKVGDLGGGETYGSGNPLVQRVERRAYQRLLFGGLMHLAIASVVMSAISSYFTGQQSTPWTNFQKDPTHTFDMYLGRDAKGQDHWLHNPLFGFQRELADYTMEAVKAQRDGKDFWHVATAPIVRAAGKANPVTQAGLELLIGREINKWMHGYGEKSDISEDPTVINIRKSLDSMGLPDWGSLEDRLIYAFRTFAPDPGFAPALAAPTNNPGEVAQALGPGQWLNPQALGAMATGMRTVNGTRWVTDANGNQVPMDVFMANKDAKTAANAELVDQMAKAFAAGDFKTAEALRAQLGMTAGQASQAIIFGQTAKAPGSSGLAFQNLPQSDAAANAKGPRIDTLDGHHLDPQQSAALETARFQRQQAAVQALMNDPAYKIGNASQRASMINDRIKLANKITDQVVGQQLGTRPGQPITAAQATQVYNQTIQTRQVTEANLKRAGILTGNAATDADIMKRYDAMADQAVWSSYFGTTKGASPAQIAQMVITKAGVEESTRLYVSQLPQFQQGDMYQQSALMDKYLKLAGAVTDTALAGKVEKNAGRVLTIDEVSKTVRNVIGLQQSALDMLHQSGWYAALDPKQQTAMDTRYEAFAQKLAMTDTKYNAKPGSFGSALQARLVADEGLKSLMDQYGGPDTISARQQELAALKSNFAQTYNIPPSKLSHYTTAIDKWYYAQHPDYSGYLAARTQWEKRDPAGILYSALSKGMLSTAASSPFDAFAPPLS